MRIPVGFGQANVSFVVGATTRRAEITFGFRQPEIGGPADAVATAIYNAAVEHFVPELTIEQGVERVRVKFGPNASGQFAEVVGLEVGPGTGQPYAPNVAMLVTKRTEHGGRTGRGRWYLPVLTEAQVGSGGIIAPGTVAAWQTAVEDFDQELASVGIDVMLLHAEQSPELPPFRVDQYVVQNLAATQRRRLRP